jgi:hypothetical protein
MVNNVFQVHSGSATLFGSSSLYKVKLLLAHDTIQLHHLTLGFHHLKGTKLKILCSELIPVKYEIAKPAAFYQNKHTFSAVYLPFLGGCKWSLLKVKEGKYKTEHGGAQVESGGRACFSFPGDFKVYASLWGGRNKVISIQ